ncbi:helix-turn-helix domain-containing protein [Streptococcus orisasini]|uniref:helix-turn-helix domain-containing protein n=1 Tax=Streptococcus orisasini TaxID=1080071 RepID=UPI00070FB530|nr:XRE family transcriptional regulator [Streptococcus orisasini]
MVIRKKELGQLIRDRRKSKRLSQRNLCGNEEKLTIRQLQRIEKGVSLPTLEKLDYIARMLEVPISDLLGGGSLQLSEDYLDMKNQIVKFPTYGDKKRIQKKIDLIENIYEKYFDVLPEDELLFLDLSEKLMGALQGSKLPDIKEIYDDAFEQTLQKKKFAFNDYLYLAYFLQKSAYETYYDIKTVKKIARKLLRQELETNELYNVELLLTVTNVAAVYALHDDYKSAKPFIDKAQQIIDRTQLYTYKPAVIELEAMYKAREEGDKTQAKELYHQALMLGEIFEDAAVIADVKMEMEKDGID